MMVRVTKTCFFAALCTIATLLVGVGAAPAFGAAAVDPCSLVSADQYATALGGPIEVEQGISSEASCGGVLQSGAEGEQAPYVVLDVYSGSTADKKYAKDQRSYKQGDFTVTVADKKTLKVPKGLVGFTANRTVGSSDSAATPYDVAYIYSKKKHQLLVVSGRLAPTTATTAVTDIAVPAFAAAI